MPNDESCSDDPAPIPESGKEGELHLFSRSDLQYMVQRHHDPSAPVTITHSAWPGDTGLQHLVSPEGPSLLSVPTYEGHHAYGRAQEQLYRSAVRTGLNEQRPPSTTRATLTDMERKKICQYAENHSSSKQTKIAAIFGLHRSTVCKILRDKEKHLQANDSVLSYFGTERDRAARFKPVLAAWAKDQAEKDLLLNNDTIHRGAHALAMATTFCEFQRIVSDAWIDDFKLEFDLVDRCSWQDPSSPVKVGEIGSRKASDGRTLEAIPYSALSSDSTFGLYETQDMMGSEGESADVFPEFSNDSGCSNQQTIILADGRSNLGSPCPPFRPLRSTSSFERVMTGPECSMSREEDIDIIPHPWYGTSGKAHSLQSIAQLTAVDPASIQHDSLSSVPAAENTPHQVTVHPAQAQKALEVVENFIQQQLPEFVTLQEGIYLGRLMERIEATSQSEMRAGKVVQDRGTSAIATSDGVKIVGINQSW